MCARNFHLKEAKSHATILFITFFYYRNRNKLMGTSLTFGENRSFKIGQAYTVFEDEEWINVPGYSWDMSPDGQRFLIVRRTSPKTSNEIKISQHFR